MAITTAGPHCWVDQMAYNQLQPTQHVKILIKTNVCTTLPQCLAASASALRIAK
jgi:hypothetical protein